MGCLVCGTVFGGIFHWFAMIVLFAASRPAGCYSSAVGVRMTCLVACSSTWTGAG